MQLHITCTFLADVYTPVSSARADNGTLQTAKRRRMECCVFSPCGRYVVRFQSDGNQTLHIDVRDHVSHDGPGSHLTATLNEPQVLQLTTAAGVRKSFKSFSEMAYHALIGRASCVKFFVESCAEMKQRITADVQHRCAAQQPSASTTTTTTSTTLDLSVQSDVAEEVLAQRFLTIDYDVDFTRAVFPIPLEARSTSDSCVNLCSVGDGSRTGSDLAQPAMGRSGSASPEVVDTVKAVPSPQPSEELRAALSTIARLREENDKLRREKEALTQLSREKMLEMQRLCEDFQRRAQDTAEVERLRRKNAELRVRLQEVQEARDSALHALDTERHRQRLQSSGPAGGTTLTTATKRFNSNPYLRSLSRGSSTERGGQQHHRQRSPLVSPTPPGASHREGGSNGGASSPRHRSHSRRSANKRPSRFDTPPPPPPPQGGTASVAVVGGNRRSSHSQSRPSRGRESSAEMVVNAGGGGDSPAPHGRTGGRLDAARKPSRSHSGTTVARGSPHPVVRGALWSEHRSSRCSSVASSTSSRASSASHERLFRTPTESSRHRQTNREHSPPRRAVFY